MADFTSTLNRSALSEGPQDAAQALFERLGALVVRFRYLIVVAWVVLAVAATIGLPSITSVSNNNNASFLPKNEPSVRAAALAGPFQRGSLPQALLVAARNGRPLTAADNTAITRAEQAVRHVRGVVAVQDQGISQDGEARKAQVTLTADAFGSAATTYVDAIRKTFAATGAPSGLSLYLAGEVATQVDNAQASNNTLVLTEILSVVVILVLLVLVYRALLAPFLTFLPSALVLVLAMPVIAEAHNLIGVQVSPITSLLLVVLLLGAGTDYGLFLAFRVREEMRRGLEPHAAVIRSLSRVGETITFSAGTVIAALVCLLLASLGFYQGLGPAMAIGIAIMLLAGLTLNPALLAIFGRRAFWPTNVRPGIYPISLWGRIAGRIVQRPLPVLLAGVVLFGGLAITGLLKYAPNGFGQNGSTSTTSQSAQGTAVLNAHFPSAQANPTNLLLRYPVAVWQQPAVLTQATQELSRDRVFQAISGPLNPNGTPLSPSQLQRLHATLGPAVALPVTRPAGVGVSSTLYNAYRATAQFINPDGHSVQFYAALRAGSPDSSGALQAIPSIRAALAQTARATGATDNGVAGLAASSYDISNTSTSDLVTIIPVVLAVIGVLLALVLRSLVAPWYLLASVGLSYLAALGLAVVVFMLIGGGSGLNFFLPFLMFIFLMALGSDYNILVMTRIREEAFTGPLSAAVTRAINATGGTVTSAGLILTGSFLTLTIAGGGQVQQIGFGIGAGILMDTFLVRTLLIPSTVVLLDRWNWWPSSLSRIQASTEKAA